MSLDVTLLELGTTPDSTTHRRSICLQKVRVQKARDAEPLAELPTEIITILEDNAPPDEVVPTDNITIQMSVPSRNKGNSISHANNQIQTKRKRQRKQQWLSILR